jgi:murein DD-endopeptidase MepM/ murein hydrolase activator NlpD
MSDFCFPFKVPVVTWHDGGRQFGARRDGGRRKHGGCDIIKPVGTVIHAVANGILVHEETDFYMNTNYVTFKHGPYLIRYGEIMKGSTNRWKKGKEVSKGQPIAKVGQLIDKKGRLRGTMLHLEMYSRGNDPSGLKSNTGPYMRRADIMDPGPFLDKWVKHPPP